MAEPLSNSVESSPNSDGLIPKLVEVSPVLVETSPKVVGPSPQSPTLSERGKVWRVHTWSNPARRYSKFGRTQPTHRPKKNEHWEADPGKPGDDSPFGLRTPVPDHPKRPKVPRAGLPDLNKADGRAQGRFISMPAHRCSSLVGDSPTLVGRRRPSKTHRRATDEYSSSSRRSADGKSTSIRSRQSVAS